jgi:hypothetical protein
MISGPGNTKSWEHSLTAGLFKKLEKIENVVVLKLFLLN